MQHKRAIRNNKYQRRGATSSVLPSVCHSTFLVRHFASMSWSCFCYMDTRSHAQPLCAVYCRLSARLWRMLTACSAASAMRSSAGWRSFMCVHCLTTVLLRVLAYAMPSAVLTVQTNCACVALRCGRLQHPATPLQRPCNGLATALQRPCNGPATALQRPCNGPATALQRPCNGLATALQRPCNGPATALQRPCSCPATGRTATVDGHCLPRRPSDRICYTMWTRSKTLCAMWRLPDPR